LQESEGIKLVTAFDNLAMFKPVDKMAQNENRSTAQKAALLHI
jgi:hypothetical protein